jgi:hypothetical protein
VRGDVLPSWSLRLRLSAFRNPTEWLVCDPLTFRPATNCLIISKQIHRVDTD